MNLREVWDTAFLAIAALAGCANRANDEAYWAAAREDLLLYVGAKVDTGRI